MKKKKFISIILCFSMVFFSIFAVNVNKAKAWPVSASIANLLPEGGTMATELAQLAKTISAELKDTLGKMAATAAKIAALLVVQKITQAIIGNGGGGGVITDWNAYLYVSPQQKAMTQMNSFFNTASRGRLSSLSYEGVGPNYDAYLVAQARAAISGQTFVTNLQDTVTNPAQVFDGGNMKGLMTYMQCANNVACYTLTAQSKYSTELTKATKIAEKEQTNGFLPVKKNGTITQPAAIISDAFSQMDQMGTKLIMDADFSKAGSSAVGQIAKGAAISIASRALNYATSSDSGKQAVINKNNNLTISSSYGSLSSKKSK